MGTKDISTEEKIKKAAIEVFTKKGFAGARTRDIAEAAGINIAMMHYYFRSKEKLFEIVIREALQQFSKGMDGLFDGQAPLHQQIRKFVELYTDFLREKPFVPLFILSESHSNAKRVDKMIHNQKSLDRLESQLKQLAKEGVIRPIHPAQFIANLVSLTVFPFISKPLMMTKSGIGEKEYDALIEERKKMIPEMIISYLYLQPPQD